MKKILLAILLVFSFAGNAQSWTEQATGFADAGKTLNSISIVNASTVWANEFDAATQDYTLKTFTRTTNGGDLWTPRIIDLGPSVTTPADLGISSISAIDVSTAWVSVFPDAKLTSQRGGIWKTIDGGVIWTKETIAGFSDPDSYANFVHFWDATHGVAVGDPINIGTPEIPVYAFEIYTFDGTSWSSATTIPTPLTDGNGEFGIFNRYSVSGNTIWFGTDRGRIYKSDDYGVTWTVKQSPSSDFSKDRFTFSDTNKGLLLLEDPSLQKIYKIIDGGTTWEEVTITPPPSGNFFMTNLTYIPGTSKVIATSEANPNGSYYSPDDGVTWKTIDSNFHGETAFLNINVGFSAGLTVGATPPTSGGIFKFNAGNLKTASFDTNNQITAYPNPTNGLLQISSKVSLVNEATVYDLLGKKVYNSKISPSNNASLDLKSLQTGLYNLKVTSDTGKIENIKIMKK